MTQPHLGQTWCLVNWSCLFVCFQVGQEKSCEVIETQHQLPQDLSRQPAIWRWIHLRVFWSHPHLCARKPQCDWLTPSKSNCPLQIDRCNVNNANQTTVKHQQCLFNFNARSSKRFRKYISSYLWSHPLPELWSYTGSARHASSFRTDTAGFEPIRGGNGGSMPAVIYHVQQWGPKTNSIW